MIRNRTAASAFALGSLLVIAVSLSALGASWVYYWGGWRGLPRDIPHYPGAEQYLPGHWTAAPVWVEFVDTPVHAWTAEQKTAVKAAVREWKEAASLAPGGLSRR